MSSPILPIEGPFGPSSTMPSEDADGERGALVSELEAGETTPELVASRGAPPPELLDQIAAAVSIYEQLRDRGYQLRFTTVPDGSTKIEVHDREGSAVKTLSAIEACEVAAGTPLR